MDSMGRWGLRSAESEVAPMSAAETFDAMGIVHSAKMQVFEEFYEVHAGFNLTTLLEAYCTLNSAWKYLLRTAWRTCPYCEETDPMVQLERTIQAARCEV